jgi:hypothetical protein
MEDNLNAILAEYADQSKQGDPAPLAELIERYPEHAREIVEFAVYDAVLEHGNVFAPEELEGESRFLRRAEILREHRSSSLPIRSLSAAAKAAGHSLTELAKFMHIGYPIMVKLDRRLIDPATIPRAIADRLAETLSRPVETVIAYLRLTPILSTEANYRSSEVPRAEKQDFQSALSSCPEMSEQDRAIWSDAAADTIGGE